MPKAYILVALFAVLICCEPASAQRFTVVPQGPIRSDDGRQLIEHNIVEDLLGGHDNILRPYLAPEPHEMPSPEGSPPTQEELDALVNIVLTAFTFLPGRVPAVIGLLTLPSDVRRPSSTDVADRRPLPASQRQWWPRHATPPVKLPPVPDDILRGRPWPAPEERRHPAEPAPSRIEIRTSPLP